MCANKKSETILRCTDVLVSGTVKKVQSEKMSMGMKYRMAGSAWSLMNRNFKRPLGASRKGPKKQRGVNYANQRFQNGRVLPADLPPSTEANT